MINVELCGSTNTINIEFAVINKLLHIYHNMAVIQLQLSYNNIRMNMDKNSLPQEKRTKCEVWTRVMGYHRPISSFNDGKKEEYKERKMFVEKIEPDQCETCDCSCTITCVSK